MTDRERAIRDLAYRIWEEAGQPEGQGDRHWDEAQRRYDAEKGADPAKGKRLSKTKDGVKGAKGFKAKDAKASDPKPKKALETIGARAGEAVKSKAGKAKVDKPVASKTVDMPKSNDKGALKATPSKSATPSPKGAAKTARSKKT